jgi:hypothetical protein
MSYDPWTPMPSRRRDDGCVASILWALRSLGFDASEDWLAGALQVRGALDQGGAPLAQALNQMIDLWGFVVDAQAGLGFCAVAERSGQAPLLLYGEHWGRWSGVRAYSPRSGGLVLANPDPTWRAVGDCLNEARFRELGPMTLLRIARPGRVRRSL